MSYVVFHLSKRKIVGVSLFNCTRIIHACVLYTQFGFGIKATVRFGMPHISISSFQGVRLNGTCTLYIIVVTLKDK